MEIFLLTAFSFLMGSIPFGVVFTKSRGINLREVGSGNIGATNVLRAAGRGAATLTLIGDLLKGTAAVAIGRALDVGPLYEGLMGLAAVVGHDFSPFQGFRGGKGVATSLGAVLIYTPWAGILSILLWLLTVSVMRYSSVGALVSFTALPASTLIFGYGKEKTGVALVLMGLVVLKHLGNIKRLRSGTERRVGEKA